VTTSRPPPRRARISGGGPIACGAGWQRWQPAGRLFQPSLRRFQGAPSGPRARFQRAYQANRPTTETPVGECAKTQVHRAEARLARLDLRRLLDDCAEPASRVGKSWSGGPVPLHRAGMDLRWYTLDNHAVHSSYTSLRLGCGFAGRVARLRTTPARAVRRASSVSDRPTGPWLANCR